MVGAFPLACNDSVGSLLVRIELSLGRISSGAHHLSQDEVSDLEISVSNSGVVVPGHVILVSREPLFNCHPDFVY